MLGIVNSSFGVCLHKHVFPGFSFLFCLFNLDIYFYQSRHLFLGFFSVGNIAFTPFLTPTRVGRNSSSNPIKHNEAQWHYGTVAIETTNGGNRKLLRWCDDKQKLFYSEGFSAGEQYACAVMLTLIWCLINCHEGRTRRKRENREILWKRKNCWCLESWRLIDDKMSW